MYFLRIWLLSFIPEYSSQDFSLDVVPFGFAALQERLMHLRELRMGCISCLVSKSELFLTPAYVFSGLCWPQLCSHLHLTSAAEPCTHQTLVF